MRGNCFIEYAGGKSVCLAIIAFLMAVCPLATVAQKPKSQSLERKLDQQSEQLPDDTVRITTDLVQTSVGVFDKRGKFIDNLRTEDFELLIDGKPHPVLFFDRISNGTNSESLKSAARSGNTVLTRDRPLDAGRTVLFFVDDLHLGAESITRTRSMLTNYIDQEMGANDQAVIASASGAIGFLQQVTGEKDVLRAAVERLKNRSLDRRDTERPAMSVYQALAIERNDADVLKYFEDVLLKDILAGLARTNPKAARDVAEHMTRSRASRIVHQSDNVAKQTLAALNSAVRSSSQLPGHKIFVFVSDGFLINNQNPDIRYRLQRITDAAVRVSAVLYTIQASGLNTTFPDASTDVMLVPETGTGRLLGEDIAVQDPLTELAADTGGRALLNSNDLNHSMKRALQESNDYYLLAWRPEAEVLQDKRFHHIEVKVNGHSDLSVIVQRGFFNDEVRPPTATAKTAKPNASQGFPLEELAAAIQGRVYDRSLPTYLTANYIDVPNRGGTLSILMQIENREAAPSGVETVDVAGVVYNESGKLTNSFVNTLKAERDGQGQPRSVTYLDQIDVKPGLYQVRVAARNLSGQVGMATQWVKVPELSSRHISLSSLLIGERDFADQGNANNTRARKAQLKIDRRFLQDSRLRFLTFIYNTSRETRAVAPQLEARIEIFHGNKAIVSTTPQEIETKNADDPARIPYSGELALASMPKGRYLLRVTVMDRLAKTSAYREVAFEIY